MKKQHTKPTKQVNSEKEAISAGAQSKSNPWLLNSSVFIAIFYISFFIMKIYKIGRPNRDSGAFLYIGQQILDGKIPYLDLWDHKGPIVFYLNALGLKLGHGDYTGVINLQILFTGIASFIVYYIVRKIYNPLCGIISAIVVLLLLIKTSTSGNQVEQWTLLFQSISLLLFYYILKTNKNTFLYALGIGLCGGIAFLLRQNQIGVWLGIFVYSLIKLVQKKDKWSKIRNLYFGYAIGALLLILVTVIYFYSHNALAAFWDSAFTYNFSYSSSDFSDKISSLFTGFSIINLMPLAIAALAITFSNNLKPDEWTIKHEFAFLTSIIIIFEMIFTSVSGNTPAHYYTSWIISVAILISSLFYTLSHIKPDKAYTKYMNIAMILLIITSCASFTSKYCSRLKTYEDHKGLWYRDHVVNFIQKNSSPNDYLLHWGTVGSLNFLSKRKSPSKFFYQYALRMPGYATKEIVDSFIKDLRKNKPKIIVDHTDDMSMPPLDKALREKWLKEHADRNTFPKNIENYFSWVAKNYNYAGYLGKMRLYILKGK